MDVSPLFGPARFATFGGFDADGRPTVSVDGGSHPAGSLVDLSSMPEGAEIAVIDFAGGPYPFLILGALVNPRVARIDDRIELVGEKEVVLRCGPASIRLTPDGRVTIRGTRVLSRSDGPNRVQGATVELN